MKPHKFLADDDRGEWVREQRLDRGHAAIWEAEAQRDDALEERIETLVGTYDLCEVLLAVATIYERATEAGSDEWELTAELFSLVDKQFEGGDAR